MTPLYIIPARGGSKGIPGKNIKPLCGTPLIGYTIKAAQAARAITGGYILLSTDSAEIASVSRSFGIETDYMRPAELGSDTTGSREVMLDAVDWAASRGIDFDTVVLLQPTSPLRTVEDILGTIEAFTPGVDMAVSVCVADANPYYNLFECDQSGNLHVCKGDGLYTRRQDVPQVFQYNGAVYVIRPESLKKYALGAMPCRVPYVMPAERSCDLDTPADWARLEQILSADLC